MTEEHLAVDVPKPQIAVLVVEDMPIIRMDAVATLEEAGYRTYQARSSEDGISLMENHDDIGVLFTDIDMPGSLTGLGLAHYVRERWPPVRIIIASGAARVNKAALPIGAKFFPKPYSMLRIMAVLRKMVV
jgi:DNA-binding NtrC family response regulator